MVGRAEPSAVADLLAAAEELVARPEQWPPLGARAAAAYRERFSLDQGVRTLRERAA